MLILGIDPGIATTGYGIIEQNKNELKIIDYGCIRTETRFNFPERLNEIHQQLKTKKKLFCRCPAGINQKRKKYDAEIIRHMRPTLSEL